MFCSRQIVRIRISEISQLSKELAHIFTMNERTKFFKLVADTLFKLKKLAKVIEGASNIRRMIVESKLEFNASIFFKSLNRMNSWSLKELTLRRFKINLKYLLKVIYK